MGVRVGEQDESRCAGLLSRRQVGDSERIDGSDRSRGRRTAHLRLASSGYKTKEQLLELRTVLDGRSTRSSNVSIPPTENQLAGSYH